MLDELRKYKQWVVHRADKIPLNPYTGEKASNSNAADWSDFDTALACCTATNGIGLGFVLTEHDPFCVIDLDNPADPKHNFTPEQIAAITSNQMDIFKTFDSYSEVSPSGKGLHIWVLASVPSGKRKAEQCTELYSSGRYMTVTLQPFHDAPIQPRGELALKLWESMGGANTPAAIFESASQELQDDEVCQLAASGANGNGDMFLELYKGNWKDYFPSESEADLTFCNIVAFYTDNKEQVARIYYKSDLFQKSPKKRRKNRNDYLWHDEWGLVTKAFDRKGPIVDLSQLIANGKQELAVKQMQKHEVIISQDEIEEDEEPETNWLSPPGLMGEIATFIYNNAVNPVPEVAVAASIAYLSGIAGRAWNISRTGLNHYVVLLAETGQGKESAAQGMDRLTHAVMEQLPAFQRFLGPSGIASPQALIKQLIETPCFLSHKGEFGMWLQNLTGRYAKSNEVILRGFLLDLFTKSGYHQTLRGSIYSDRQKNVPDMDSPAFSLFGDSTQQEFYKALDEDNVGEGLVSRFTVIQAKDQRPKFNPNNNIIPINPDVVWKISGLGKLALELEMMKVPVNILEEPDAVTYHHNYREWATDKMYEDRSNKVLKIWNRAHLRLLRLAGLAAVSCNPEKPVLTVEHLKWAETVINHSVETILHRFNQGSIGEASYSLEQTKSVGRLIRRYCKEPYYNKWQKTYSITKEMHQARVVTNRFLQLNSVNLACFRNSVNPTQAYKNVIETLIANGNLQKIELSRVKDTKSFGVAYYVLELGGLSK